ERPFSKKESIRIARKFLNRTFSDRNSRLLRLLIRFIENTGEVGRSKVGGIYGTQYFQNVWEAVCANVLSNDFNSVKERIPQPKYEGLDQSKAIGQRPDIILVDAGIAAVVDAKYYDTKNSLPGWK